MARKCAFCGVQRVTKEHVIPEWVSRYILDTRPTATGFDVFSVHGPAFEPDQAVGRPSGVIDYKVKRVCKPCNENWMSDLENASGEIIKPMIDGREIQMGPESQTTLAKWAVKTAMMVEFSTPFRQIAAEDRAALYETQTVPDGHHVYLAAGSVDLASRGFIFYIPLYLGSDLGRTTGYALTLSIHHFVMQVVGSGKAGGWILDVDHGATDLEVAVQAWPMRSGALVWPPRHALPDFEHLRLFAEMPTKLPPDA